MKSVLFKTDGNKLTRLWETGPIRLRGGDVAAESVADDIISHTTMKNENSKHHCMRRTTIHATRTSLIIINGKKRRRRTHTSHADDGSTRSRRKQ